MKRTLFAFLIAIFTSNVYADQGIMGLHCGPRGNFFGTIASDYVIPDYFPPENFLLRSLLSLVNPWGIDLSICEEEFSLVHLGQSCLGHDQCYATLGETKDGCDEALFLGWQQSCSDSYLGQGASAMQCLNACQGAVTFMYNAMLYDDGVFCPSCIAFESSQAKARRDASNR